MGIEPDQPKLSSRPNRFEVCTLHQQGDASESSTFASVRNSRAKRKQWREGSASVQLPLSADIEVKQKAKADPGDVSSDIGVLEGG